MGLFGVSDMDMLDFSKIKVFDGIAGSAKSSAVDAFFRSQGVPYGRYTSSHKLRRDALERYGGNVKTIAGGLFQTVDGVFFADDKETAFVAVVIDEILQTDPRALDWCVKHLGQCTIVICTDSRQMLTPHGGAHMAEVFAEFCKRPDVIYTQLTYSYRPVDDKTRRAYDYLYAHALEDTGAAFAGWVKRHGAITADALTAYDAEAAYICHSNDIEKELYSRWDLSTRYDIELIPKGNAASRDNAPISQKVPILPQADVTKTCARYYQVANLGSTTRYQGTEVQPGHKCYFICSSRARVTNREWYTALTRCKSVDSLQVVYMDVYKPRPLTSYAGKPIKELCPYRIDGDTRIDGRPLSDILAETGGRIPFDIAEKIAKDVKDTPETHFSPDFYMVDGVYRAVGDPKDQKPGKKPVSAMGLLSKEPALSQNYMPDLWRKLETLRDKSGKVIDAIASPCLVSTSDKPREAYGYACDLYSAYSYVLHMGAMPDGSRLYPAENRGADWVRLYYVKECPLLAPGCICTGVLVDYIREHGYKVSCECLGSVRRVDKCMMGDYLYSHVHSTQEDKQEVKGVRYGFLSKPYLLPLDRMMITGEASAYSVDKGRTYEILMCAIKSELAVLCLKIREAVSGEISPASGVVVVDCVYFDSSAWSFEIGDAIKAAIPGYDFRLHNPMDKDDVFYKTYADLPTRAELKKQRDRERRAAQRMKEKCNKS